MKSETLKSIGAILAGFVVGAILSLVTDTILELTGIMKTNPFDSNPAWLICLVVVYRTVYNATGAYVAGRLAPANPMKHAMILGIIGFVLSIVGTIAMWHIPPHWYPITLLILVLPAAWCGGKLAAGKK